ncbi:MAG: RNase adapter RapZ [Janthinobacterium lividum]
MTALHPGLRVVLVSGLSGAGKASILRALEDVGYEAVDNPPLTMVPDLAGRAERPLAVGLDARSRGFDAGLVLATLADLREKPGLLPELVYATADETALLRRYTETRRRHPLAPQGRVVDGIAAEAALTQPLRDAADLLLDTSELPLAELRRLIEQRFKPDPDAGAPEARLVVSLISFAFPAGLPREADMVFDARFLRNPHYDPILRPGTGLDADVAAYVEADPDFLGFYNGIIGLLDLVLPRFVQEGKRYATVAVGCTGGRHRSVRIVERLAAELRGHDDGAASGWQVTATHRELARKGIAGAIDAGTIPGPMAGPDVTITQVPA